MAGVDIPLRWAVVVVNLDPIHGSEQAGIRPVLVVSYEAFHQVGMMTVCPISGRPPKYPGEVTIPTGEAGQTKDGVILVHQMRTISAGRIVRTERDPGLGVRYVHDPEIRQEVRAALATHLGLDTPSAEDGADWDA